MQCIKFVQVEREASNANSNYVAALAYCMLVFVAFVGLFTLPRLYEQNKAQLDVAFEQLQKHFSQLIKQAREKVGGLRKKSQ